MKRITSKFAFTFLTATLLFTAACTKDSTNDPMAGDDNTAVDGEVWTGAAITFTKTDNADPASASNQDRITDNVWITRGNDGGQIYNAKAESGYDKQNSPVGTLWAQGSITEVNDLNFRPFRTAVASPKDVVGKDLVLYLVDDKVYLSVKFTEWSSGKAGGFAYERSTK